MSRIDITDRKQAEIAKADFISNMEHDLRTPFTGISGIANVLYSLYKDKDANMAMLLENMLKSCEKWEAVHDRIFDVLELLQKTTSRQ